MGKDLAVLMVAEVVVVCHQVVPVQPYSASELSVQPFDAEGIQFVDMQQEN